MNVRASALLLTAMLSLGSAAAAQSAGWTVTSAEGQPTRLSFDGFADKGVRYAFVCEPDGISITETGVTALMDPKTGGKVGDDPGSVMLDGAAVMALFTDRTEPKFIVARARPNEVRGWDLTMKLQLNDPAIKALPRAKAVSLMTTGWTGLAELEAEQRNTIANFLAACSAH
jgi:hypothetical protein